MIPQAQHLRQRLSLSSSQLGTLQVALGAIFISFSSVFVHLSSTGPTADGVYRMLFGGSALMVVALARRERIWGGWRLFGMMWICALTIGLDLICWHRSIHYIGPGLATILGNFQVFGLILVGILVDKEQVNVRFLFSVCLAMVGLFLLVGVNWGQLDENYRWGVYFGLLTAVSYSVFTSFLRRTRMVPQALPIFANLGMISLYSALLLTGVALFQGESLAIETPSNLLMLIAYGLIGQFIGWMLISRGLPRIPVSLAGLLILLQPALSFLWDMMFFHRPTTTQDIVGVLITFCALYLGMLAKGRKAK